jgi:hypothetical protein
MGLEIRTLYASFPTVRRQERVGGGHHIPDKNMIIHCPKLRKRLVMRIDTKMKKQPSKEKDARAVVVEKKGACQPNFRGVDQCHAEFCT